MNDAILLELHYLGSIPYFAKLLHSPQVIIEQHEHYRKGSFRNRCYIGTAQGPQALSIPLTSGKHQQAPIQTVRIDNKVNWQLQHWRSIKTAYGKSPFYDYYAPLLAPLYEHPYSYLFDFCQATQTLLLQLLGMAPNLTYSNVYQHQTDGGSLDFRHQLLPRNYVTYSDPDYQIIPYPQVFEDRQGFVPNLSVVDLLFCTGPEALIYLQQSRPI